IGITNCMNFGSPERPEVMGDFAESIRGMSHACLALGTPVTGGNVSFYNEHAGASIDPTPVIGMVGIVAEAGPPPLGFRTPGDLVALLGATKPDLAGSEYLRITTGRPGRDSGLPALDLDFESALGRVARGAIGRRLLTSAHDISGGGLAAALTEACLDAGVGATVEPEPGLVPHVWLFSESAGRILVSLPASGLPALQALAAAEGVPVNILGIAGGGDLKVGEALSLTVEQLRRAHEDTLPTAMNRR
ncbi:MAG: AIR synthase-related protein, partial [Actinomycetota bacterium]